MPTAAADAPRPDRSRLRRVVLAAAVLPLVFLWRTLLLGQPLVRDDASLFVYPMYAALSRCLAQGQLYLWDPAQYCGLPALAAGQTGQLYPPHLLLFRLVPWMDALHVAYGLHLALALLGFVWVARNLKLGWPPAALGGLVYVFSGYSAAHLVHYNFVTAIAHLPLMLAVLQTALARNQWRWWGLLGLEIALAFLCSHPQVFLMGLTVLGLWVVAGGPGTPDTPVGRVTTARQECRAYRGGRGTAARQECRAYRVLPGLLAAGGVAALLVMPQALPTAELVRESRGVTASEAVGAAKFVASYPFRLLDLARVALPDLLGTADANVIGGGPAFHETCAFIGSGALVLLLIGLVAGWRRPGYAFALAVLVIGASLMPAGNPVYHLVARLPLLAAFRAMGRWALLPMFASGLLVAMALQYLPELTGRTRRAANRIAGWTAGGVIFAVFALWFTFGGEGGGLVLPGHPGAAIPVTNMAAAIYNSLIGWEPLLVVLALAATAAGVLTHREGQPLGRARTCLLGLALALPLWHFWQVTNRTVPRDFYLGAARTAMSVILAGKARITHLPPELVAPDGKWRNRSGLSEPRPQYLPRELLTPALGTVYGLSYAEGYKQGLVTPSTLRWWQDAYRYSIQVFTGQVETTAETIARVGTPYERMKRFHRVCGVQYIVTPGTYNDFDLPLVSEGQVRVHRYKEDHPRAWLVGRAVTVPNPESQLLAIKQRAFDPYREAVVDGPVEGLTEAFTGGTAEITGEDNLRVEVATESDAPALLVLADAWYPGWQVAVDGAPARLLRADYAIRAVAVPAGNHRVELRYAPAPWRWGLWLMAAGLALLAVLLVIPVRRAEPDDG